MYITNNKKVAVLLSGGQDSTTCLMWAINQFGADNVSAISFNYGQKHVIELKFASKIAEDFGVRHVIFDVSGLLGGSALTDHNQDINAAHATKSSLPASFTAGRNALFLTIAGSYADSIGCHNIVTGVCETDFSGYPDCRNQFVMSQQLTLSLALDDPEFKILTPLMWLDKAETWRMAAQEGAMFGIDGVDYIVKNTLTDYNGSDMINYWGRGNLDNPASILRKKGFDEAVQRGYISARRKETK